MLFQFVLQSISTTIHKKLMEASKPYQTGIELILTQYNFLLNLSWQVYAHFLINVLQYESHILTDYSQHNVRQCIIFLHNMYLMWELGATAPQTANILTRKLPRPSPNDILIIFYWLGNIESNFIYHYFSTMIQNHLKVENFKCCYQDLIQLPMQIHK